MRVAIREPVYKIENINKDMPISAPAIKYKNKMIEKK